MVITHYYLPHYLVATVGWFAACGYVWLRYRTLLRCLHALLRLRFTPCGYWLRWLRTQLPFTVHPRLRLVTHTRTTGYLHHAFACRLLSAVPAVHTVWLFCSSGCLWLHHAYTFAVVGYACVHIPVHVLLPTFSSPCTFGYTTYARFAHAHVCGSHTRGCRSRSTHAAARAPLHAAVRGLRVHTPRGCIADATTFRLHAVGFTAAPRFVALLHFTCYACTLRLVTFYARLPHLFTVYGLPRVRGYRSVALVARLPTRLVYARLRVPGSPVGYTVLVCLYTHCLRCPATFPDSAYHTYRWLFTGSRLLFTHISYYVAGSLPFTRLPRFATAHRGSATGYYRLRYALDILRSGCCRGYGLLRFARCRSATICLPRFTHARLPLPPRFFTAPFAFFPVTHHLPRLIPLLPRTGSAYAAFLYRLRLPRTRACRLRHRLPPRSAVTVHYVPSYGSCTTTVTVWLVGYTVLPAFVTHTFVTRFPTFCGCITTRFRLRSTAHGYRLRYGSAVTVTFGSTVGSGSGLRTAHFGFTVLPRYRLITVYGLHTRPCGLIAFTPHGLPTVCHGSALWLPVYFPLHALLPACGCGSAHTHFVTQLVTAVLVTLPLRTRTFTHACGCVTVVPLPVTRLPVPVTVTRLVAVPFYARYPFTVPACWFCRYGSGLPPAYGC